jgi:predicted permease
MKQTGIMFLLMSMGIFSRKKGMFSVETSENCSKILSDIVIPATMIYAFQGNSSAGAKSGFWLAFAMAALYHVITLFMANLMIPGKSGASSDLERVAAVAGNCAFMGFPLVRAALGEGALIYGTAFIAVFNLFIWAWSALLVGGEKPTLKNILLRPQIISVAIGLILFGFSIKLPDFALTCLKYTADLNTPLAMLVLGAFLAEADIKSALKNFRIYRAVFIKNFLSGSIFMLAMTAMQTGRWIPGAHVPLMTCVIISAAPTAVTAVFVSARYGRDSAYAAQLVAASTLFSLFSIALLVFLASFLPL